MDILRTHHAAVICSDHPGSKDLHARILGPEVGADVYRADRGRTSSTCGCRMGCRSSCSRSRTRRGGRPTRRRAGCGTWGSRSPTSTGRWPTSPGTGWRPSRSDPHTGKRFTFFADPDGLPLELDER